LIYAAKAPLSRLANDLADTRGENADHCCDKSRGVCRCRIKFQLGESAAPTDAEDHVARTPAEVILPQSEIKTAYTMTIQMLYWITAVLFLLLITLRIGKSLAAFLCSRIFFQNS